ncbi:MAG: transporter substrate-binding domain-containing protein [Acidimicrobiales bacterium]
MALAIFGGSWKDIGQCSTRRASPYAQRIPKVASGEVDLIAHMMTINCTRWQQVAFSGPFSTPASARWWSRVPR